MAKEIKIKVTKVRDVDYQGKKFKAYQCLDGDGNTVDLKFTRDCHNVPTERCFIYVDSDKVNVNRKKEYPVVWVKDVNRIEPIEKGNGVEKFFGVDDDENPFA